MYILINRYVERDLICKYQHNIFRNKPVLTLNITSKPFLISQLIQIILYFYYLKNLIFTFKLNNKKSYLTKLTSNKPLTQIVTSSFLSIYMSGITTNSTRFSCFTHLNQFKLNNITNLKFTNTFNYQLNPIKTQINCFSTNIEIIYSKLNCYRYIIDKNLI